MLGQRLRISQCVASQAPDLQAGTFNQWAARLNQPLPLPLTAVARTVDVTPIYLSDANYICFLLVHASSTL